MEDWGQLVQKFVAAADYLVMATQLKQFLQFKNWIRELHALGGEIPGEASTASTLGKRASSSFFLLGRVAGVRLPRGLSTADLSTVPPPPREVYVGQKDIKAPFFFLGRLAGVRRGLSAVVRSRRRSGHHQSGTAAWRRD